MEVNILAEEIKFSIDFYVDEKEKEIVWYISSLYPLNPENPESPYVELLNTDSSNTTLLYALQYHLKYLSRACEVDIPLTLSFFNKIKHIVIQEINREVNKGPRKSERWEYILDNLKFSDDRRR